LFSGVSMQIIVDEITKKINSVFEDGEWVKHNRTAFEELSDISGKKEPDNLKPLKQMFQEIVRED
jgi:hypothetical protein